MFAQIILHAITRDDVFLLVMMVRVLIHGNTGIMFNFPEYCEAWLHANVSAFYAAPRMLAFLLTTRMGVNALQQGTTLIADAFAMILAPTAGNLIFVPLFFPFFIR